MASQKMKDMPKEMGGSGVTLSEVSGDTTAPDNAILIDAGSMILCEKPRHFSLVVINVRDRRVVHSGCWLSHAATI